MTFLFLTADKIGTPTGGGQVTYHEFNALSLLAKECGTEVIPVSIDHSKPPADPFTQDEEIYHKVEALDGRLSDEGKSPPALAHCYAGCLDQTVRYLRSIGCKVSYTVAAHDVSVSREEHERIIGQFPYPHLTDPYQFGRYINGYIQADHVIVPSHHSLETVRKQGRTKPITRVPHGHAPYTGGNVPYPKNFTLGYLGAVGPDKGLCYLLQAWKALNYRDATLVLAGAYSTSPFMRSMIDAYGGGNITVKGWVDDVSDFYNSLSCYVQPSASEGFGIEVLEAMSHGRPVVCSRGAGAVDVVGPGWSVLARNVSDLMNGIEHARRVISLVGEEQTPYQESLRRTASDYTWDGIYPLYHKVWRELL